MPALAMDLAKIQAMTKLAVSKKTVGSAPSFDLAWKTYRTAAMLCP